MFAPKTFPRTDFLIKRSLLSSKAKINFCPRKFEGVGTVLVFEKRRIDEHSFLTAVVILRRC